MGLASGEWLGRKCRTTLPLGASMARWVFLLLWMLHPTVASPGSRLAGLRCSDHWDRPAISELWT